MELAGLEPVTSWVRSSRLVAPKTAICSAFREIAWSAATFPATLCIRLVESSLLDPTTGDHNEAECTGAARLTSIYTLARR
jgi:hypothetical protein